MEINLTKTATFVTADSIGACAVLCEFPQEKTGDLAGQGFLQGMAGIPKESADLSNSPPKAIMAHAKRSSIQSSPVPMSLDWG